MVYILARKASHISACTQDMMDRSLIPYYPCICGFNSFLVRINNSLPCQNLNRWPLAYQANVLPAELSCLDKLKESKDIQSKDINEYQVNYFEYELTLEAFLLGFHLLLWLVNDHFHPWSWWNRHFRTYSKPKPYPHPKSVASYGKM